MGGARTARTGVLVSAARRSPPPARAHPCRRAGLLDQRPGEHRRSSRDRSGPSAQRVRDQPRRQRRGGRHHGAVLRRRSGLVRGAVHRRALRLGARRRVRPQDPAGAVRGCRRQREPGRQHRDHGRHGRAGDLRRIGDACERAAGAPSGSSSATPGQRAWPRPSWCAAAGVTRRYELGTIPTGNGKALLRLRLPSGSYRWRVEATDLAGWEQDRQAPGAFTIK